MKVVRSDKSLLDSVRRDVDVTPMLFAESIKQQPWWKGIRSGGGFSFWDMDAQPGVSPSKINIAKQATCEDAPRLMASGRKYMDISHFVAFLIGAATGAAGHYFGEKYSDQRRNKDAASERKRVFRSLAERMRGLLAEMKADLNADQENVVREFFVLSTKGSMIGFSDKKRFRYNESEHESLREKLDFLQQAGFIHDLSNGRTPLYRMEEHFVGLLRHEQAGQVRAQRAPDSQKRGAFARGSARAFRR